MSAQSNAIDQLETEEQVIEFIIQKIDSQFKESHYFNQKVDSAIYAQNSFLKLDLDGNGLNDLFIEGRYLFSPFVR